MDFHHQRQVLINFLKKFGFSTVKTASTPMETSKPLMKDENAKDVGVHLYRSMIGSLMYLTSSRPDIIFVKPAKSDRFEGIIDFMNASSIRYALTVNPTIYTSCVKQFWATAKAKTVNGEVQIQALVDGKKVIVTETKSPEDLMRVQKCNGSSTQDKEIKTPIIIQPSTSQPQKKQPRRKQRKDTEVPQPSSSTEPITDEAANEEHVPTHSNDPLLSGEDRLKLNALMKLCTNLSQKVIDLENTKTSQVIEITKLKERVKKLERRNKSRTLRLKRLRKVGRSAQIVSSEDEGLGAQEDAAKQGRKIDDLDADAEVTLVDEAQGRNDDNLMFDTRVLDEQEVEVEKVVSIAEVTTVSATTPIVDELTLAQTLIDIKAAKPKAITITTIAVTRPKARGVVA
ncbi:hypothetical protein Tco_1153391 [Tanacetum coccineum]